MVCKIGSRFYMSPECNKILFFRKERGGKGYTLKNILKGHQGC